MRSKLLLFFTIAATLSGLAQSPATKTYSVRQINDLAYLEEGTEKQKLNLFFIAKFTAKKIKSQI